jgi:RHS repeat-associated protein
MFDLETGNYLARHRYYTVALASWFTRDPIGYDAGDVNLYRYCANVPMAQLDPLGLDDIRIKEGTTDVVQWMPEGFLGRDQPWGAVDIGTVDGNGVVTFSQRTLGGKHGLSPMPLSVLQGYGGEDSIGALLTALRAAQEENPENNWSGGKSVADYWKSRVTACECVQLGTAGAETACQRRMSLQAAGYATVANIFVGVEGGASAGLGIIAGIAFTNGWNPVGWTATAVGAGLAIKTAYDFQQLKLLTEAGEAAEAEYCDCTRAVQRTRQGAW